MTENESAPRAATLADVASLVGVSTRTVSRVVNNEPGISETTRQRIKEAVRAVGYRPNMAARRLVTNRSELIGLVIPHFDNPYFPLLALGVEDACAARGQTVVLGQSRSDPKRQAEVIESLVSHGIDGLILFPADGAAELGDLVAAGLAVVTVNWPGGEIGIGQVSTRFAAGAALVADHFADTGHTQVAIIATESEPVEHRFREQGFLARVGERGLPRPVVAETKEPTVSEGTRVARELLLAHPEVTAIFAYNDLIAIGAMRACHELGRSVPESCAIVGFDDIDLAASLTPSLSTVHVDRALIGRSAVELLGHMVAGTAGDSPRVDVDPELRIRESSDRTIHKISV